MHNAAMQRQLVMVSHLHFKSVFISSIKRAFEYFLKELEQMYLARPTENLRIDSILVLRGKLSFIHTSQFFLGKFIPAIILLNPNYAKLEANFPKVSSQNGRKQR